MGDGTDNKNPFKGGNILPTPSFSGVLPGILQKFLPQSAANVVGTISNPWQSLYHKQGNKGQGGNNGMNDMNDQGG